jgi:sortase A
VRKPKSLSTRATRLFKLALESVSQFTLNQKARITKVLDTAARSSNANPQGSTTLDTRVVLPKPTTSAKLAVLSLVSLFTLTLGLLFHLVVISPMHYTSSQIKKTESLRYELANGTAPVGQVNMEGFLHQPGTPLAIISIPKIGVEAVIVEGTTSAETMGGVGHRRDTVLPGQEGISVLYGRQAAYGGVFGRLGELKAGDTISVLTGQGKSEFAVKNIRSVGDEISNAQAAGQSRLTLVSASGLPFLPSSAIWVDAELKGAAKETPIRVIPTLAINPSEQAMNGDLEAVTPIVYLYQILLLIIFVMLWVRRNWGRAQSWVVSVPLLFWTGTSLAEQITRTLSNLL